MKRILVVLIAVVMLMSLFASCGSSSLYKDGTYTAESKPDDRGSSATLTLTIKGGKIEAADWKELSNGEPKGENYGKKDGKIEDQASYDKAQNALKISQTLGDKLIAAQDVSKIDGVSGATGSFTTFKTLVGEALAKAKK